MGGGFQQAKLPGGNGGRLAATSAISSTFDRSRHAFCILPISFTTKTNNACGRCARVRGVLLQGGGTSLARTSCATNVEYLVIATVFPLWNDFFPSPRSRLLCHTSPFWLLPLR